MTRRPRPSLLLVLATLLVLAGLTSLVKSSNIAAHTGLLSSSPGANSTALYCTGLSGTSGGEPGHFTFLNTTGSTRKLNVQVVSDKHTTSLTSLTLGPHRAQAVVPEKEVTGNTFAVAVQVNGGGVVGEEVTKSSAEAPCVSSGVTNWYASGFDTTVGSTADLSIYNPTATPAVFNISAFSPSGYAAPAPFQGLAVGAHEQTEINLGTQIVNTSNIGVRVRVLRGSIVVDGVQRSGSVASFAQGQTTLAKSAWYPAVTTVNNALAQIRVTNPSGVIVNVVANVEIANYTVAPQDLTVAPYASGDIVITPNSAIPAAGYASVRVRASAPVATSLVTGTSSGTALSSMVAPSDNFIIADFAGKGFDVADVTNTSKSSLKVTFTTIPGQGGQKATGHVLVAAGATQSILGVFSGLSTLRAQTLLVTGSRSTLLVTLTLPTTPVGVSVVAPLDGG
jgi:hypothetical protein